MILRCKTLHQKSIYYKDDVDTSTILTVEKGDGTTMVWSQSQISKMSISLVGAYESLFGGYDTINGENIITIYREKCGWISPTEYKCVYRYCASSRNHQKKRFVVVCTMYIEGTQMECITTPVMILSCPVTCYQGSDVLSIIEEFAYYS
jgi:hypothetical protein